MMMDKKDWVNTPFKSEEKKRKILLFLFFSLLIPNNRSDGTMEFHLFAHNESGCLFEGKPLNVSISKRKRVGSNFSSMWMSRKKKENLLCKRLDGFGVYYDLMNQSFSVHEIIRSLFFLMMVYVSFLWNELLCEVLLTFVVSFTLFLLLYHLLRNEFNIYWTSETDNFVRLPFQFNWILSFKRFGSSNRCHLQLRSTSSY